jgi:hypothetical protein
MKHALFGPLYNRTKRFSRVVVNITTGILFVAMIDRLVRSVLQSDTFVGSKLIGHQMGILVHKTVKRGYQLVNTIAFNLGGPYRTGSLDGDKNSLFFRALTSRVDDAFMITGLAANVFLIQFDNTAKRREQLIARVHHFTNCMADFPGTFLRNANPFTQTHRRDAFAGLNDQKHRQQPFPQRQFCAVHRCFAGYRKLSFALGTLVKAFAAITPFYRPRFHPETVGTASSVFP